MLLTGTTWLWHHTAPTLPHTESSILYTLLVFCTILLLSYVVTYIKYKSLLPPGPWGVPVLGFLPFLEKSIHLQLTELSKFFGKVFSIQLGQELIVVISDPKVIKEAFRKPELTGKQASELVKLLDGFGIINVDGHLWKQQRRFLHERLRKYGMKKIGDGREKMEARIMLEVEYFLQSLATTKSAPTDPTTLLAASVSNVICSLLMSVRFQHTDPSFQRFMHLMDEGFKLFTVSAAVNFLPVFKYVPGINNVMKQIRRNKDEMHDFVKDIIDAHKKSFRSDNIRDIVDSYLLEFQEAEESGTLGDLYGGKDTDCQLQQVILDLFSAGMETVKTTLLWSMLFMMHHPEVQAAVQDELDAVVGRTRLPSLEDQQHLPYTEATILEIMRITSVVAMGTVHTTTETTDVGGYILPKDTQVLPLLYSVHHDPDLWERPDKFDPTRFINGEGQVEKPDFFMPFGVGRRMCLGDVLARMEIFLFLTSLLHVFHLESPPDQQLPDLAGDIGATLTPKSFKVSAQPRSVMEGELAERCRREPVPKPHGLVLQL